MYQPKAGLGVCAGMLLAFPLLVCAEDGISSRATGNAETGASGIQLAAAIGIIRTEPEAGKKPEIPVQPAEAAPPPVAQQAEPVEEEVPPDESTGISKSKILLGVGVAALLGAVAGGGGGGNSSPTTHSE